MAQGLKVTLKKGIATASTRQLATISGLGLWRFGQSRVLKDTKPIRGMAHAVRHLVSMEEVNETPVVKKQIRRNSKVIEAKKS